MTSLRRYKLSKVASDTLSTGAGVAALCVRNESGRTLNIVGAFLQTAINGFPC
jgi:hypothetical protein